jgi:hypothetical protein
MRAVRAFVAVLLLFPQCLIHVTSAYAPHYGPVSKRVEEEPISDQAGYNGNLRAYLVDEELLAQAVEYVKERRIDGLENHGHGTPASRLLMFLGPDIKRPVGKMLDLWEVWDEVPSGSIEKWKTMWDVYQRYIEAVAVQEPAVLSDPPHIPQALNATIFAPMIEGTTTRETVQWCVWVKGWKEAFDALFSRIDSAYVKWEATVRKLSMTDCWLPQNTRDKLDAEARVWGNYTIAPKPIADELWLKQKKVEVAPPDSVRPQVVKYQSLLTARLDEVESQRNWFQHHYEAIERGQPGGKSGHGDELGVLLEATEKWTGKWRNLTIESSSGVLEALDTVKAINAVWLQEESNTLARIQALIVRTNDSMNDAVELTSSMSKAGQTSKTCTILMSTTMTSATWWPSRTTATTTPFSWG